MKKSAEALWNEYFGEMEAKEMKRQNWAKIHNQWRDEELDDRYGCLIGGVAAVLILFGIILLFAIPIFIISLFL
jgi:hypothetical protein